MTETAPDELVAAAIAAAKSARRAVTLTLLAVAIAVIVLIIDQGIKRDILAQAERARKITEDFRSLVLEAADGIGADTAAPGGGHDAGDDLVRDPGVAAPADPDVGHGPVSGGVWYGGQDGRPPGDG